MRAKVDKATKRVISLITAWTREGFYAAPGGFVALVIGAPLVAGLWLS